MNCQPVNGWEVVILRNRLSDYGHRFGGKEKPRRPLSWNLELQTAGRIEICPTGRTKGGEGICSDNGLLNVVGWNLEGV